jgi:hypothetical protein
MRARVAGVLILAAALVGCAHAATTPPAWLVDPTQVALAYAAARGWPDPAAVDTTAAGVTIRSTAGTHALTLAQPGKTGTAGIWVVTADS